MRAVHSDFLPKSIEWDGEQKSNFTVENLTSTTLSRCSRLTLIVMNPVDSMMNYVDIDIM